MPRHDLLDRLRLNVGCHACARASMLTRREHGTQNSHPGGCTTLLKRPSRVSNPYKRNRTANSCCRTRGTWITSLLYFSGTGTIPRPGTTVCVKGKPHNGLARLWLALSGPQEGSSPAPRPECSLRLEKVSKVTPLRESKLTSEGLLRQQPENGWCDRSQGGTCHPGRSMRLSIGLSVELVSIALPTRSLHTKLPSRAGSSSGRPGQRDCPQTLGKLCGTKILDDG